MRVRILILIILLSVSLFAEEMDDPIWTRVEHGAHYSKMKMPVESFTGENEVDVYKFNPDSFAIGIYKASHPVNSDYWHWQKDMLCIINATMVDEDNVTALGAMKGIDWEVGDSPSPDMNMIMFLTPRFEGEKFIFRTADEKDVVKQGTRYSCMTQGIGLIRNGKKLNYHSDMVAGFSAVGKDSHGNLIFMLCRQPYRFSELPGIMASFNLDLTDLMLVEKGPNAYVSFNNRERIIYHVGSYEFGKYMGLDNKRPARVPYTIGLKRGIK